MAAPLGKQPMGKALVLGGGGNTGYAWQWGMLTGLHEAGVDLAGADLLIGTSAGALAAAHLACGMDLRRQLEIMLSPPRRTDERTTPSQAPFAEALSALIDSGKPAAEIRARLGALALSARAGPESTLREIVADYLPGTGWPGRRLLVTAVDAASGALATFGVGSGASLVDAVAASCALPGVWSPVTIGTRRYLDAIIRSPTNADLAAGYARVVVLAPVPDIRGLPGAGVQEQTAPVRAAGEVLVLSPDEGTRAALGRDPRDASRQPEAARASLAQSASVAGRVRELWDS
ncbi:patatin-like phospholipase family protein [Amycolatopsis aidingensis]|uniref:patatin-like phospholipase family protein n=1 Tax=Amycolatopsis aidingensis TaxID=2842453 RepID=UPI001C0A9E64|nr:patatin-like phospholipase family protein [Amycolatopsis aidingensis]